MTNKETMTNKEAKDVLQEQIDRYGQEYDAEGIEALEIAINVLEQQPCEDCISRKEALECARLIIDDEGIMHEVIHVDDIKDLPSVKPKAEPPVDAVSRQAVIDYIKGHIHEIISASGRDLNEHTNQVLRAIIKGVEVLPRK